VTTDGFVARTFDEPDDRMAFGDGHADVDVGPGTLISLAPDHDSWTLGDEPVVFLDIDPIRPGS
jgi:hypothetical protein